MILRGEKDRVSLVKRIITDLNEEVLDRYWNGFNMVPFALYDEKKVYLANHSSPPETFEKADNIYIGPWTHEFYANTMIKFAGEEIAIIDLNTLSTNFSYEKIYSLTVHEMFHAYQMKVGFLDHIKYNEMMFMKYPFTAENIELRVREREELLKAAFSKEEKLREKHLRMFITLRERRTALIGEVINYELGLESIEGTATYVEYKANIDKSCLPTEFILSKFGDNLSGYPEDFSSFRHSCYSPGMFLCLILDRINKEWQKSYMYSKKHLYDFFLDKVNLPLEEIEEINELNFSHAQYLADQELGKRKQLIDNFNATNGYKVVFNGDMLIGGFNPMQVVPLDNQILHQTFLKVNSPSNSFFINGECLAKHCENPWKLEEAIFFTPCKPVIELDTIKVQNIGEIKGSIQVSDDTYYVQL